LKAILNETNSTFLKWALDKIGKWQNLQTHPNLVHIHGTADKILSILPNLTIKLRLVDTL